MIGWYCLFVLFACWVGLIYVVLAGLEPTATLLPTAPKCWGLKASVITSSFLHRFG